MNRNLLKKTLILTLNFVTIFHLFAQKGPGGVGNNIGTSTLSAWYDANQGVNTTGTSVTQWSDMSGYGNNATPPATTNRPTLTASVVNNSPVLTFNGTTHFLTAPSAASLNLTRWSIFIVGKINTHKYFNAVLVKGSDNSENYEFLSSLSSHGNIHYPVLHTTGARSINAYTVLNAYSNTAYGVYQYDYNQANFRIYINGSNVQSVAETRIPRTNSNPLYIGNEQGTTGRSLNGTLAEIAIFSTPVNSAQRIIIQNYLAAKYGLSLTSNDIYVQDNPANGNYDYDVAGIGRIDASNIHNDAQGTGIVRILNPTSLTNNNFLIWGHNNGSLRATNKSDVPTGVQGRFNRVWRVNEVNSSGTAIDVGAVDMRWDLNGIDPVTASDLRLLIDDNNNGVFSDDTPIAGAVHLGGGIYEFQNVPGGAGGIRNNRRFTLGTINLNQTPLPIDLAYFNANNIDNRIIKLEWATVAESNNDFFTIERSLNGVDWEIRQIVKGAGNSSDLLSYSFFDDEPYQGISYYRLKQTDYDGKFTYSNIENVTINSSERENLLIYPNPTDNIITIIGSETELSDLKIYNTIGQDVIQSINIVSQNESILTIDLSNLSEGIYCIKTKTNASKVYKQ